MHKNMASARQAGNTTKANSEKTKEISLIAALVVAGAAVLIP